MATGNGRRHFQEELKRLEESALGGIDMVLEQLDRVLETLEHQDIELAQIVILDDDRLDGRYLEVHQGDNAVDIGEVTAFVVSGLFREFSDSSAPTLT